LVLEQYVKEGLKANISGGLATPGQRDGVKGLKVLMECHLATGEVIPKGSIAYIKEETLHNHSNTMFKPLTCATMPGKFMIVDLTYIEFIDKLDGPPGEAA
jgi:hypothetical protein